MWNGEYGKNREQLKMFKAGCFIKYIKMRCFENL